MQARRDVQFSAFFVAYGWWEWTATKQIIGHFPFVIAHVPFLTELLNFPFSLELLNRRSRLAMTLLGRPNGK